MPHQLALTVRAEIHPGRFGELLDVLAEMSGKAADNRYLPFGALRGVHFARLFVLPDEVDIQGVRLPASLVYMCDVDVSLDEHLDDLVDRAGTGVDAVFGRCLDYPQLNVARTDRLAWLRAHVVQGATRYVHTVGRSVDQVVDEERLRAAIEDFLDRPDTVPRDATSVEVHRRIRDYVQGRADLRWAVRPARGPDLAFRVRETAHLVGVPALVLLLSPVLVPAAGALLLRIRWLERRDVPDSAVASAAHLAELERYEDFVEQNPFTAIGLVKLGTARQLALRSVLAVLGYSMRHIYNRDNLAGVRTIHFARWLPVDGGRRMIFASNYDDSVESYMDDFIEQLAWGLNAVFSNGLGFPATRWLLGGGARDEMAFKRFLRRHQIPTQVWYTAYGTLPARNIDDTARLRRGLARPLSEPAAAAWLALL